MINMSIVIPTFSRIQKLKRCLDSLKQSTFKNFTIYIFCDNNDKASFDWIDSVRSNYPFGIFSNLNSKQEYGPGCWNKYYRMTFKEHFYHTPDTVLHLVDDTEVLPNTLANALACMIKNYPTLDGVVGLAQVCKGYSNYTFKIFGQCLYGNKFINRYVDVNYAICCKDYLQWFQDEETYNFADKINKFIFCKEAIINHNHPSFTKDYDNTHYLVRGEVLKTDTEIFNKRNEKGLIWGESFELIKNEKK